MQEPKSTHAKSAFSNMAQKNPSENVNGRSNNPVNNGFHPIV
jgi:hypothetical protein